MFRRFRWNFRVRLQKKAAKAGLYFVFLCGGLWALLTGCTTYELPTKNNPYDSEAETTEVCPEENPDCIQDCRAGENRLPG